MISKYDEVVDNLFKDFRDLLEKKKKDLTREILGQRNKIIKNNFPLQENIKNNFLEDVALGIIKKNLYMCMDY